jgi:hypothetical protein
LYEIDSEGDIVDVRREISVNIKDTATIQALNREIEKQDDNIKNIEQIIM